MDLSNILGGRKYVFTAEEEQALAQDFYAGRYKEFIDAILARETLNHTLNMEWTEVAELANYFAEELKELVAVRVGEKEFLATLTTTTKNIAQNVQLDPKNQRYFFYSPEFKDFKQRQEVLVSVLEKYELCLERYAEGYRYSLNFINPRTHEPLNRFYKERRAAAVDLIQTYRLTIELNRPQEAEKN